jgi:ribitol-5-phosphate 2-dehydrogenase (NADP+) / D-ribitol-5-phosphate cytidylyltransferase
MRRKRCSAILLMGGSGNRFGSEIPKQFHYLLGKRIYLYTLELFLSSQLFDEIILVCHEMWIEEVKKEVQGVMIVKGGETRQESSYAGLRACREDTDYVVIHDAVRPFVTKEILERNIAALENYAAVDTCIASADTIIHAIDGIIRTIPKRSEYLRGQTPQSFHYPLILSAHKKAQLAHATEDCQLLLKDQCEIAIIEGDDLNMKITNQFDLLIAEQLLLRQNVRHDGLEPSTPSLKVRCSTN